MSPIPHFSLGSVQPKAQSKSGTQESHSERNLMVPSGLRLAVETESRN